MWLFYPQENCYAYSHTQQNVKSSSVSECGCNEEGSINGKCDTITGQCFCKKYQWNGQRCHIPISNCSSDQITCKSGQCVGQKSWLCDSCQACDDSSDEDDFIAAYNESEDKFDVAIRETKKEPTKGFNLRRTKSRAAPGTVKKLLARFENND